MSTLDKWLPLWIGLAMVVGLLLGRFVPALSDFLARLEVGGISVPIGIGLLVMMYPVLAKVRYDKVAAVTGDKRLLISSLLLNWIAGPAVMFTLRNLRDVVLGEELSPEPQRLEVTAHSPRARRLCAAGGIGGRSARRTASPTVSRGHSRSLAICRTDFPAR